MKKIISIAIAVSGWINMYSQSTYVFFGSFNRDKAADGIYVYQLNTDTGKLSKVVKTKNILNPSYVTLSPNGKYIFACTESKTPNAGSVSSFEFDPAKKTLNFINSQKSGGENPVYVTVHKNGKWLLNGNYTEGSISVYPISDNGKIYPMVQRFQFSEGSVNPERQDRSHIHSTVFSPDFDYVFAPDLGADKIRIYQFKNDAVQPMDDAEPAFIPTMAGTGPRHFTFHPNGKFAYCIEELGGAIDVYSYENGRLEHIQRISTHKNEVKDNFESSDVHISPDGKFLYASNRGNENNIAIFSILENGILKTVGYQPTFGKQARVFEIDEEGKFLIVTNAASGNAFVFRRNQQTGLLQKVGRKLKIKGISCVKIKKYHSRS
ncbi:lactonase family protein [Chryseobacterium sp. LAM-KRS1]|uniref:lactonase family protein n=1 Tax=Chryseobacterium sp. LAM-KRS1 TaxID=2715754 RepID=UPI00293BF3D6|nr:lactonase family protein [Chryseobacterium sp. LAM-KRS1]